MRVLNRSVGYKNFVDESLREHWAAKNSMTKPKKALSCDDKGVGLYVKVDVNAKVLAGSDGRGAR